MATKNKLFQSNEIYFLTFTILDWQPVFTSDKYANLIYKWFDYMKDNYGNKVYGYVIMPNHVHLLLKVTERSPLPPRLIQNAKRFLAYQIVAYLERQSLQSFPRNCNEARGEHRGEPLQSSARDCNGARESSSRNCNEADRAKELLSHFRHKARTGYGAKHKVFKDNYDSLIIQSRKFFLEKLNYIHKNPCTEKWNLAEKPEDYRHSSAANYFLGSGVYPVEVMEI